MENSLPPQLIETTLAPCCTATSTACSSAVKLLLLASTSTIFALGAITCAHSTSKAISNAQPASVTGLVPLAYTFLKHPFEVVQVARPYVELKCERSAAMFGSSYASTILIVCPEPWFDMALKPYAPRMREGEIPVGEVVASLAMRSGGCAYPAAGRYANTGRPRSASCRFRTNET